MSELITISTDRKSFRWQLLATTSALALAALTIQDAAASDQDSDRPTVWIELGGQLEALSGKEETFAPPFISATPRPAPQTIDPLSVEGLPKHSFGAEGKISIQPENSNWIFSAALRYGRSNASRHIHQQSYPTQPPISSIPGRPAEFQKVFQFVDARKTSSETHAVLDFQAGKDVGLGAFGSSTFNLGVRFAQFGAKSNTSFGSDPDHRPEFKYFGTRKLALIGAAYHSNMATASTVRNFHGVGPSFSWDASTPLIGHPEEGRVAFDWGVNAALLFGRQRANVHHHTTAQYHNGPYGSGAYAVFGTTVYRNAPPDQRRSHSVTVPNVGGFAGLSFLYANAKLSAGYRADFFFNAMDGGIDTRKSQNIGFYGPFATISIGLGG